MDRAYVAVTVGVPPSGTIRTWHGRHPTSRVKFTSVLSAGRRAVTHVHTEEVLASRRAAVVSCRLETGRTHQIRVHLSEQAKTPVFADAVYGGMPSDSELRAVAVRLGRQALHARLLGFEHPVTHETMSFSAPIPDDMTAAIDGLRALGTQKR